LIRFQTIWLTKWTSQIPDEKYYQVALHQWGTALHGIDGESIAKALEYCKMNLEWPPSIAEFLGICRKSSGVPDFEDAFKSAIRRDFKHPAVEQAYLKIGSWDFSHGTEKELRKRFKAEYDIACSSSTKNKEITHENKQIQRGNESRNGSMRKASELLSL